MRSILLVSCALAASVVAATLPLGCDVEARPLADEPTYRDDVAAILDARCARCHAGAAPAAGFSTNTYRGAIGCTATGAVSVLPADAAPLVLALSRPDHQGFASDDERATLARWVATGAQSVRAGVHPRGFADPRSGSGHAAALRATRYRALTDPEDRDSCAQCHDGAGARPKDVTTAAPGATACTTCHAEPGGVSACATCHGGGSGPPVGPRDRCFFPADAKNDAHAAHAAPSRSRAAALDCASCHPRPALGNFTGAHTDGYVEVWFDHAVAGRGARFDGAARRCTGTCHDRGGTLPAPTWSSASAPLDCNACHTSPPKAHFTGPCSSCHREADAAGTALTTPLLHVDGKVDLGDGSGRCGACHGSGDSPWPSTGAHAAHALPAGAASVACETCHAVPGPNDGHPLRAGAAVVRLAGLATKGGRPATYDAATKTCAATYCHDGAGASATGKAPRWTDGAPAATCGSCHATPPPAPHPPSTACGTSGCHEGITTGALAISAAGRAVHVNGIIDRRLP
jgi:predicted CxxxxCH...CXXCH cytochrome family protein